MKYFFDTEFHEYKKNGTNTIELISIGIVAEDGREFYAVNFNFDFDAAWDNQWLRDNVLSTIFPLRSEDKGSRGYLQQALTEGADNSEDIARKIIEFVGEDAHPEFYAYYADYDWVVFCWLFGRMIDLPKGFPMYCRDLKQTLDETAVRAQCRVEKIKADPDYPKQDNEHNALDDARWNFALYRFLTELYR